MKPFQIEGRDKIFEWLAHEPDLANRQLMLTWLADLANDPLRHAHRVPGVRAPVYLAEAPVRPWFVTFLYAEQFHTVKVIEFGKLP